MAVPAMLGAKPVGLIALANSDMDYTDRELGAVQRFADLYAVAIGRKQAQGDLVQERLLLRTVIDNLPDAIYAKDMQGRKTLANRVNSEDKSKLDEYLTSVRDVEKRLATRSQWVDLPKPDQPFDKPSDTNTVDDLPLLYELIALALQTDSTRVATLEIGGSFLPQNLGIDKSYHGLSHHGRA